MRREKSNEMFRSMSLNIVVQKFKNTYFNEVYEALKKI